PGRAGPVRRAAGGRRRRAGLRPRRRRPPVHRGRLMAVGTAPLRRTEQDAMKVDAALAEAGWPGRSCLRDDGYIGIDPRVPHYIAWKAVAVAGLALACWPCESQRQRGVGWPPAVCDHPIDPMCPERIA